MNRRLRALSGIKPTGTPHLGNYFGMVQPAIALQDTHDAYYFVADYHALTTGRDAALLRRTSLEITATFMAFGLDPARAVFFRQSAVPEVMELAWHLSCVTGLGLLMRAHAYKAALDKGEAGAISAGTFSYPVLMAADILLYDSDVVPVGKDQVQHVEMAQDMAGHLNAVYGECLRRPEASVAAEVATIPGLDGQKMSKSYQNTIEVFLGPKPLRKLVRSIKTDGAALEDPKDPTTDNVFALYKLVASQAEVDDMAALYRAGGFGYGHAKERLADALDAHLAAPRERYHALLADPSTLEDVLAEGARRARAVGRETLERVRERIGLPKLPA